MSDLDRPPAFVRPRAVREVLGVVVAGSVAAICFLVVAQEGFKQGLFDLDTNAGVGVLFGADGEGIARRGLAVTVAVGILLSVVQRAISARIVAPLWVRMLPMAAIVFLGWGLVFAPLLESRDPQFPAGPFASQAGGWAIPVIAVASLVFALVAERVSVFVRDLEWWAPKHFDLRESLEEIFVEGSGTVPGESLELAEKGPDDRREHPRG